MSAVDIAHDACAKCVRVPKKGLLPMIARSIRVDRVFLHPVAGPLLLAATMFVLFQALFTGAKPLMDGLTALLGAAAAALRARLPPGLLASLVCDGGYTAQ